MFQLRHLILSCLFGSLLPVQALAKPTVIDFVVQNQRPRFGIQYSQETVTMSFLINVVANLKNRSVSRMTLNFVKTDGASILAQPISLLNEAAQSRPIVLSGDQAFSVHVRGQEAKNFLAAMSELIMQIEVYSKNEKAFESIIDLGHYCQIRPENFANLINGTSGCP